MAITTTPRFGLVQWGAGSDSPSRTGFNGALASIDAKAAYDDGAAGGTTLPSSGVFDGRYAQTINGSYRQFYRRAGGAWQQVGGNTWGETVYARADTGLATSAAARIVSHPNLTNATVTENWDGSSSRGGRQAISDLNSSQPGALHVGDASVAVDLTVRGRVYARTTAADQRGFVASAHSAVAGNLFSAIESGGSVPWLVDSTGRMRSTVPTAFGTASPVTGVPISVAASGTDVSAFDATANTGRPALRVFRATGDSAAIALFEQNKISLGRSTWTGGRVDVYGPSLWVEKQLDVGTALNVGGALDVNGRLDVEGAFDVNGATTLAGLTAGTTGLGATNASSLTVPGTSTLGSVGASSLTVSGTSTLGSTSVSSLTVSGSTTFSGALTVGTNLTVTQRLALPTNQPSGTTAGQVRVNPGEGYTLEVYDGSAWHGHFGTTSAANSTGRKHSWSQSGTTNLPGNDVYAQVSGFVNGGGGGSIASMSSGNLKLNKAGLWSIMATMFCDNGSYGVNRLKLLWVNGAFPRVGDAIIDTRCRQIRVGLDDSGNGEAVITWVGYVTATEAAANLQMLVAQLSEGGAASAGTFYALTVEYLGA